MASIFLRTMILCAAVGTAGVAQNIQLASASVVNAASYIPADYPNGGVSHGGMFIVTAARGSAPLGVCGVAVANQFPIATNMNGTTMKIAMAGASYDVPMIYVVACQGFDQLAGIVPSNVPLGTGTVTVSYNGKSGTAPISVVDRTFGMFTINQGGTGAAILQNFNSATDLPINTLANAAKPGQYAVLWGTGLGPDGNPDASAPNPTDIPVSLQVYVGGQTAPVLYKGRSGCCSGIDQIVFQVPSGVDGCFVPVAVQIGNAVSNFATMSISEAGGACSDANGITAADVQKAQQNNKLRVGFVNLLRSDFEAVSASNVGAVTRADEASAAFADLSFTALLGLPVRDSSVTGACTVWRGNSSDLVLDRPPILGSYVNLDAGTITVGGAALPYRGQYYNRSLGAAGYREPSGGPSPSAMPAFFEPGSFTVSSAGGGPVPGGHSIGAFSASINAMAVPSFDNRFAVTDVQRSQGVTVNWSGADASALVEIRGNSLPTAPGTGGAAFFCVEKASAGHFTVPPSVLLSLPASASNATIGLSVAVTNSTRISIPNVDAAFLRFTALFGRNVNFR